MTPALLGAAADAFIPTWYPGCALWLDPSWGRFQERTTPATPAGIGDLWGTWIARTGQVYTAPADANRPTVATLAGATVATMLCAGTQYMDGPAILPAGASDFTMAATVRGTAWHTGLRRVWQQRGSSDATGTYAAILGIIPNLQFNGQSNDRDSGFALVNNTTYSIVIRFTNNTAPMVRFRCNGATGSDGNTYGGLGSLNLGASNSAIAYKPGRGEQFIGNILDIVIYSRALSDGETLRLSQWMASRSGAAA